MFNVPKQKQFCASGNLQEVSGVRDWSLETWVERESKGGRRASIEVFLLLVVVSLLLFFFLFLSFFFLICMR